MYVKLTPNEVMNAWHYAGQCLRNKQANGIASKKQDQKRTDLEILAEGFACEMALYKFLGIPYVFKLYIGGDKIDLVYKGKNCAIKKVDENGLKIPEWQHKNPKYDCDYYFGVEVVGNKLDTFFIAGYITRTEFEEKCCEKTFYSKMYVVDKFQLTPFKPRPTGVYKLN